MKNEKLINKYFQIILCFNDNELSFRSNISLIQNLLVLCK